MSSLKHKKYEEIYGPWEASIRKQQHKQQIKLAMQTNSWYIPSHSGWRHSEESKQKISNTYRIKREIKQQKLALEKYYQQLMDSCNKLLAEPRLSEIHPAIQRFLANNAS